MANKLHQQAVALAQANTSGLAARQSAITAAHPKLGATQIANRALKQVTRLELKAVKNPSPGLQQNLAPAIVPDAGTVSNGSAGGGGVTADSSGGIITAGNDPTASTTAVSGGIADYWGNLSTTGKAAIVVGGAVAGLLIYRHFKG